jgi:hypothetical protein
VLHAGLHKRVLLTRRELRRPDWVDRIDLDGVRYLASWWSRRSLVHRKSGQHGRLSGDTERDQGRLTRLIAARSSTGEVGTRRPPIGGLLVQRPRSPKVRRRIRARRRRSSASSARKRSATASKTARNSPTSARIPAKTWVRRSRSSLVSFLFLILVLLQKRQHVFELRLDAHQDTDQVVQRLRVEHVIRSSPPHRAIVCARISIRKMAGSDYAAADAAASARSKASSPSRASTRTVSPSANRPSSSSSASGFSTSRWIARFKGRAP